MKPALNRGGLVYSTDSGRMCPQCRQPQLACICRTAPAPAAPAGDGVAKVTREKKGRGGKTVTVVRHLALEPRALAELARDLKTACGSGGTLRDGTVEIQGDHVERVLQALALRGLKAKRAGG
ncbi:MAG: translation initiation factor Sui1 [Rhodoferax sp.]|nr:translation initiation factor Sui1 [Rhodoferax sp.]